MDLTDTPACIAKENEESTRARRPVISAALEMRREDQNFKLCLGCRDFKTSMGNLMSPYLGKYKEVGVTLVVERDR